MKLRIALLAAAAALIVAGCAVDQDKGKPHDHDHDHDHAGEKHGHHHKAPHDGTLVVLGKEFAHLEFVLDGSVGKLSAFALDGEAEKAIRLTQPAIELTITSVEPKPGETEVSTSTLHLIPVVNALTGESTKETSEYSGQADRLKGVRGFKAIISSVELKGQKFESVSFPFPEGNE